MIRDEEIQFVINEALISFREYHSTNRDLEVAKALFGRAVARKESAYPALLEFEYHLALALDQKERAKRVLITRAKVLLYLREKENPPALLLVVNAGVFTQNNLWGRTYSRQRDDCLLEAINLASYRGTCVVLHENEVVSTADIMYQEGLRLQKAVEEERAKRERFAQNEPHADPARVVYRMCRTCGRQVAMPNVLCESCKILRGQL